MKMPPKKAIKKVVKKKNVKKNIRNKLMKNKDMTISEPSFMNTPGASPMNQSNQASNIAQLHGPNSLRAQLLARASFAPTLGYIPQQYGSINTERRIEQLRTDNQTNQQQISNDKVTIKEMEDEIKEQKKQIKELKSQRKNMQTNLDKATHDREMTEDTLHEKERIDMKTKREEQRKQTAELQMAEQTRQNEIIKYKKEADEFESQVHDMKIKHQHLQDAYDKNKEYQRMQQLKEEYKYILNENVTLMDIMKDPEFTSPNEKLIELQKDIMKQKHQKELNEELIKKQKELNDLKIQMASVPKEDLEAITRQHVKQMNALNKEILDVKDKMMPYQKVIDDYEYSVNQIKQLNIQLSDAYNKHTMLQQESSKLETKNKGELGKDIKKKLETLANQKVINDANERRIERANQIARMKENDYQNQLIINELNKGINDNEQQQIQEIVSAQSKQEEQKRNIELLAQHKNLIAEDTRNTAIINELKKEMSSEQKQQIESYAVAENKLNENKQYMNSLTQYRNIQAEEAKAKAQKAFYESEEYNQAFQQRAAIEVQTQKLMQQNEQQDMINKAQKELDKMKLSHDINTRVLDGEGMNLAEQVNFLIDNKLKPIMNDVEEKKKIIQTIYNLKEMHPESWNEYIKMNPSIPQIVDNYINASVDDLQNVLKGFQAVIDKPLTNTQQLMLPPPPTTSDVLPKTWPPFKPISFPQINQITSNPNVQEIDDDNEYD